MNKKIDVSIVVVTYNSFDTIKECIDSIEKTVKKNSFEIVVVDNNSSDGSAEGIKYYVSSIKYENVRIIPNKKNIGFSKANNQGVKISQKSRYVLFLNPDAIVYENTIDGMVDFMNKTPNAGAATCFIELKNGRLDDSCHRGFPTPWRSLCYFMGLSKFFPKSKFFAGYNMTYLGLNKTHEIDALGGSFMLIRRDIGKRLGWWDEDYPLYGEDIDFCYRIHEAGYHNLYWPTVTVLHYKGVTTGMSKQSSVITTAKKDTIRRVKGWSIQAMEICYKKHYVKKYPFFINWLVFLGIKVMKFRRVTMA